MSQAIQPLRIQKNAIPSSPNKMSGAPVQRPLAELSPMERRRNSPSYNQNSRKIIHNADSSPFDSSPFASNSPRLYWQHRDSTSPMRSSTENKNPLDQYDGPPSPTKRSSIENLKRASRVKNSNMFAREHKNEYDPTSSPVLERPLATGRPLGVQVQENGYGNLSLNGFRKDKPLDSSKIPVYSPNTLPSKLKNLPNMSGASSKPQVSPTKSSLSGRSRYTQPQAFDPENGIWSEDEESFAKNELPPGKTLHRHAKSVTFDAAPPQINEYEMTTPDPSSVASGSREGSYESAATEEEESFDRGSSIERDDSFDASLEDTDKTPVVLPEDWRFMSPGTANDDLAASMENPFDGRESSPAPLGRPDPAVGARPSPTRTDSAASSGERRPLPPLPALGMPMFPRARSDSNNSLLATAERVSSAQRTMPSPPRPASISKSEIQGMGGCSMSIEDRLRLMMNQDEETSKSPAEEQRERRLRRAGTHSKSPERGIEDEPQQIRIHEDEVEVNERANLGDDQMRPRISRESILRKVKGQLQDVEHEDYDYLSPSPTPNPARDYISSLDPDTPLPSLEGESFTGDADGSVFIKQEDDEESEVDVYSIPDLYSHHFQADTHMNAIEEQVSFKGPIDPVTLSEEDDESHYSDDFNSEEPREHELQSFIGTNDDGPPTPRAEIPGRAGENLNVKSSHRMSLPQFASMLGEQDFGFGFESFMTPSPPLNQDPAKSSRELEPIETVQRPITPDEQLLPPRFPGNVTDFEDEPKTPESVIRYPPSVDSPRPESPIVPEPVVTIKASDGKLKTRPSLTPADIQAMADTRRHVSNEAPSIPAISESPQAPSVEILTSEPNTSTEATVETSPGRGAIEADSSRSVKRKSSLVQLEVPVGSNDDGLGFGLDKEFDRLMEAQKVAYTFHSPNTSLKSRAPGHAEYIAGQGFKPVPRDFADGPMRSQKGYLMRQNTKVVVATSTSHELVPDAEEPPNRGTRSAGNSPRKPSQTQTWTTEPWNGKIRRKSVKLTPGVPHKKPASGPAPPLPGQQSNVSGGLESVTEDQATSNAPETETEECVERGRLFVKVVRVKDLELPLPRGERSYFALTLDNGLHCVTTAWLELGKTAPIGQEFELVVLNDLEFQLTLQTKLEEPKAQPAIEVPTKSPTKTPKSSTFSRVFASPRKRKELEMKQQEEAQRVARQKQQDAQASRRSTQPTAWDLLNGLVAKDGSFARSYVCLKDHESSAYGRPYTVDVPCFNEWATEEVQPASSVKSKRSTTGGIQRKAPYRIGKLELQLLYVPRPKGAKHGDMPKSMNACIRELNEAETSTPKPWEGHLSQQGGDCPYWRRRFFTLAGSKLTAYHEATRQPRATINLAKASKLIDDKSALMRKETSAKGGARRKSAFAEEEEGYMFVEEGFRVRFANGETIDFYADSAAEKDSWMKVLAEVVGKDTTKAKSWTDLVLAKQRAAALKTAPVEQGPMKNPIARSAPPTPARPVSQHAGIPPPVEKSPRHAYERPGQRRADNSKAKSMVF